MVQIVILQPSGDHKVMKTAAVPTEGVTGAAVAKAMRKTRDAVLAATYVWKGHNTIFSVWSFPGSKGATNTHQLPPPNEDVEVVGDLVVTAAGDEAAETWVEYYTEIQEGGGNGDDDPSDEGEGESESEGESETAEEAEEVEEVEEVEEEEEEDEEDDDEEDDEEEEVEEEEEEEEEAEEDEEEEEEEEDDGCYDDGDEAGGGSKRRAPRRRTVQAPEYRRLDMGLKSKLAMPLPIGKRAPRWQTAPELAPEEYA